MAPPPVEFGNPTFVPGALEITTPVPAEFPPLLVGGAADDPRSNGPPAPAPLLPRPFPESSLPPPNPGGGGTTVADPSSAPARPFACDPFPDPPAPDPFPSILAGGGTTCGLNEPAPDDRARAVPPAVEGGGGTGCDRTSPLRVAPQLFRSRLTSDGGGATTAGAGNDIFRFTADSRGGAETGGAITSVVCERGVRELAKSRGVSCGAGATTGLGSEFAARNLSGTASGAGRISDGLITGRFRVFACETSGGGATIVVDRLLSVRPGDELKSGEGSTAFIAGNVGAVRDRNPSLGGGPGFAFSANRFATAASLCGRLMLGASTTFSPARSPWATRIVCVR
jgi:hypothetical protein